MKKGSAVIRHVVSDTEDLRELSDAKRPDGHHKALQYSLSEAPVWLLDFLQYTLICLVQRFW
jgi:hypothetical protein